MFVTAFLIMLLKLCFIFILEVSRTRYQVCWNRNITGPESEGMWVLCFTCEMVLSLSLPLSRFIIISLVTTKAKMSSVMNSRIIQTGWGILAVRERERER